MTIKAFTSTVAQVFADKMCFALQGLDDLGQPVYKAGRTDIKASGQLISLPEILEEKFDTDAHITTYRVQYGDGEERLNYDRVSKNSLGAIRQNNGEVWVTMIAIDIDLCDLIPGSKGKVSWQSLEKTKAGSVWQDLVNPVDGLPPAAAVYKTTNGVRIVHPLLEDVPAGAKAEAVINAVHMRYLRAGILIDRACKDWTRMFRAPNVCRDGVNTWEQPWFEVSYHDKPEECFLMASEVGVNLDLIEDSSYVIDIAQLRHTDAPSDEDAYQCLFDDAGKATGSLKQVRTLFKMHRFGSLLSCTGRLLEEGGRNSTLVQMAGVLAKTDIGIEVCYAVILETIKLLDQDEDWRFMVWGKLREFRATDEAKKRAEEKITPKRIKEIVADPVCADEPEVELRDLPVSRVKEDWVADIEKMGGNISTRGDTAVIEVKNLTNLLICLRTAGWELYYDDFAQEVKVTNTDRGVVDEPISDRIERSIMKDMMDMSYDATHKDFTKFLMAIAEANSVNPVQEYLVGCYRAWDGVSRLDRLLPDYAGTLDNEYTGAVGAISMVSCVSRVFSPGCKHDTMLILEGPQGAGKSLFLQALGGRPDWFLDDFDLRASAKEVIERTGGKWIVESSELVGMHSKGWNDLKSLLSRQFDKARPAYGKHTVSRPRQFVVFGTTNESTYLGDATGNRRFWPVTGGDVDLPKLRRDLSNLWGEAVHRWRRGESLALSEEQYGLAADVQESRLDLHSSTQMAVYSELLGGIKAGCFSEAKLYKIVDPGNKQQLRTLRDSIDELGWSRRMAGHISYFVKGSGDVTEYEPYEDGRYVKLVMTKKTVPFEQRGEDFTVDLSGYTNAIMSTGSVRGQFTRRNTDNIRTALRDAGWSFSRSHGNCWVIGKGETRVTVEPVTGGCKVKKA